MKKVAAVAVVIAIGACVFLLFRSRQAAPENPAGAPATVSETAQSTSVTPENPPEVPSGSPTNPGAMSAGGSAALAGASKPVAMPASTLPPLTVLDNARVAVKHYGSTFGENPVGTNAEITEALMGKNPKGINFITEDSGLRVNENGEMVDAWGTPFFFHQISGKEMEIHSAGKDRKMWTLDDLVTR